MKPLDLMNLIAFLTGSVFGVLIAGAVLTGVVSVYSSIIGKPMNRAQLKSTLITACLVFAFLAVIGAIGRNSQ